MGYPGTSHEARGKLERPMQLDYGSISQLFGHSQL